MTSKTVAYTEVTLQRGHSTSGIKNSSKIVRQNAQDEIIKQHLTIATLQ
jgi:hypothetical protein